MATNLEQVVTQNVKCSICLDHFNEPKLLSCSHTFCLVCLANLFEAQRRTHNRISCPQCREITDIQDGDVCTLKTNVPLKSMVEDFKNAQRAGKQICTNCESGDKPLAEIFCEDCREYMCASCHQAHAKLKRNSCHQVITMTDIKSGKSAIKKRRKCMTHSDEEETFFCIDCNTYICFRCRVIKHNTGHHVVETKEHENDYKKNIKSLQQRAEMKEKTIRKHISIVKEQRKMMKTVFEKQAKEINKAYKDSVECLKQRRDKLLKEYKEHEKKLDSKLETLEDVSCKQITSVSHASVLVGNGMKATPEGHALTVQNSLCQELEQIMSKDEPDSSLPRVITRCAEGLKFTKSDEVFQLGSVKEEVGWVFRKDIALPSDDRMSVMKAMPDGRMAVGYGTGGIQVFSVDGPQEMMLKGVQVRGLSILSDGRYVVHNGNNYVITLYTPQGAKLDVKFETQSRDESGMFGGLDVDKDDFIYVGYRGVQKIQVFKPTGGKAVREIACLGYKPMQIMAIKSIEMMVVMDQSTVRLMDQNGSLKNDVTKSGAYPYPAVCRDNTILIAWVNHSEGLITIMKYSHELKYMETLVTDYKIQIPVWTVWNWYYLQEFRTGEIAFCTMDHLYTFQRSVTLADVIELVK